MMKVAKIFLFRNGFFECIVIFMYGVLQERWFLVGDFMTNALNSCPLCHKPSMKITFVSNLLKLLIMEMFESCANNKSCRYGIVVAFMSAEDIILCMTVPLVYH